ncbi:hypothetical protein FOZG_06282 [Fusarium oxysporum Fo47]|uniref:Uncharacterized protein n=1 Tax=Fusarium oxysporum Fo47 TaxID=660027 RepID=W9KYD7_FUSOX|nr:hypothetical protein FOZG_06282 [Fusarium oxysporum Fo47]
MNLSVSSGYESYSYRLDPHDEVDDGYAAKAFRPVSDQQVLLRRRHVRNKRRETFDAKRGRLDENSMGFGQNALDLVNASNCSICILYPDGSYSNSSQFYSPNHYAMAGYIPAPCWPALVLQLQAGLLQLFT